MVRKVAISLDIPIRWKMIANGKRVIEQTALDEIDVDVREGSVKGESWLAALPRFLEASASAQRRAKRLRRRAVEDFDSRRSPGTWDQNTSRGNSGANRVGEGEN